MRRGDAECVPRNVLSRASSKYTLPVALHEFINVVALDTR